MPPAQPANPERSAATSAIRTNALVHLPTTCVRLSPVAEAGDDREIDQLDLARSYAISTGHGNDLVTILRRAADALEQRGVAEAVHVHTQVTEEGPVHHFRFFWLADHPEAPG